MCRFFSACIVVLAVCFSHSAAAQHFKMPKFNGPVRAEFACNFFSSTATYNPPPASGVTDAQATLWMSNMIDKITAVAGVQNRFFLKALKDYNNCSAICFGNNIGQDRYVQFDRDFLEAYQRKTNNKWFVLGVVAHEIGHHLNGHSLDGIGSRPQKELEADEFAGYVMQKLGSPLLDAQNIFSFLNETQGPPSHPIKRKRYDAIKRGWDKAAGIISYQTLSFNEADEKQWAVEYLAAARSSKNAADKMKLINQSLQALPDYAEALSEKGLLFLDKNLLDSAFFYTAKAVELEPQIGLLYLNVAKVFYYAKLPDDSKAALTAALHFKPVLPEAYLFMAQVAFEKKDYTDALFQSEIAQRMGVESAYLLADILAGKAIALYQLGRYKEALAAMNNAKELDPLNFRVVMLYDEYKKKGG